MMHSKQIHCVNCGRVITTLAITIEEKAHVQDLKITAVCDQPCSKRADAQYVHDDFETPKPAQDAKCVNCGGSMNSGKCIPCEALK